MLILSIQKLRVNKQNTSTESEVIDLDTSSVLSKPIVNELCSELTDLVDWQIFAAYLPNITNTDIRQIEHDNRKLAQQKLDLFGTWLERCSNASWEHVIIALKKSKKNALADAIKTKFDVDVQRVSNATEAHNHAQPANQEVHLSSEEGSEEYVVEEIKKLQRSFLSLVRDIRCKLDELVKSGKLLLHDIAAYIEEAHVRIRGLTKLNTIDELFEAIRPLFDYLDCELLEMIAENFVHIDDITHQVKSHNDKVKLFKRTAPIKDLKNKLQQYTSIPNISDMPVTVGLQTNWGRVTLDAIEILVRNLLQYQHEVRILLVYKSGSIPVSNY